MILLAAQALAHQPVIVGEEPLIIDNPEISRAFYDELKGTPRSYLIESDKEFDLYVNLLAPKNTNPAGRYSARIYQVQGEERTLLAEIIGDSVEWKEFYEPFGGDSYLKGPEFKQLVPAGKYAIEVYNPANQGKYVLAVGEKEFFGPGEIANVYITVPRLKADFFGSNPISFLWTPFGILAVIVFGGAIYLLIRSFR
jgi:hypothetical protein